MFKKKPLLQKLTAYNTAALSFGKSSAMPATVLSV